MAKKETRSEPVATSYERRDFLRKAAVGAAGAGILAGCGDGGAAGGASVAEAAVQGPEINWRMATSYPPSLDILNGTADRMAEKISSMTGGRFNIRVFAAGEIVPALQVMDAVQQGTIQCGYTSSYYYIGKNSALAFDSAVPFGFNARQQIAWLFHAGGLEVIREVFSDFGIISFPAGNTGAQMGGWFRRPIESVSELSGLRMRIPGMGGEVLSRLGVSVQVLGGADIYPALERGAIDATEWVGAYDDEKLGFQQIAPLYYYPGWWEPGPNLSLQVNQRAYDELPEAYREVLNSVTREYMMDQLARYDAENPRVLEKLVREDGVQLRPFSEEIMEACYRESQSYLEEQAAANPSFKKVYDSFKAYRDRAFPFFAGNELQYARFTFPKVTGTVTT
jgi:TRAP-type mannitol/chloroaromatic compound transport system substrate-binding protein